ncbi:glycosyltransferase [Raineyella fluvialis]|uniref:Glycosyltransferase n=1 Tax=Raineyella fluvialis TaxID=2662261 RepID=A0A5Q2FBU5_9ACTN|nr:glycosyltransferase [Raineyella fluvialis]QGF23871.1 glycosyltransferase [Raineyella fluvialis]
MLDHTGAMGGAELALIRLLDHLDPAITTHTVLFSEGPFAERLEESGHSVEVLPLNPRLAGAGRVEAGATPLTAARNALRVLPYAVRLGLRLRRLAPDLIHSTSLKADLIAIPAALIARRPLVWHIHDRISPDYLPGPMVRLMRTLARWAPTRVIVNSAGTAATLPKVPRIAVAYPGYSADQLGPSPLERRAPATPVVGILGRVSPTKGQIEFVRAAALVRRDHPDTRFRIIGAPLFGEDTYEQQVRAEVAALGLEDAVEFTGFVADPSDELDQLTVCVHASGQPEPFGQVIVEAMARGIPVVATHGGGVTEIVRPAPDSEPLGWLVPPGDPSALADAVAEALEHPEVAARRALAAWLSVQERFPISRTAAVVSEVWRSAARAPRH